MERKWSRLSISTIVYAMCSLGPIAEEILGLIETNWFYDTLEKNNVFNRRKSNILGGIQHVPKPDCIKSHIDPPMYLPCTPSLRLKITKGKKWRKQEIVPLHHPALQIYTGWMSSHPGILPHGFMLSASNIKILRRQELLPYLVIVKHLRMTSPAWRTPLLILTQAHRTMACRLGSR